MIRRFLDRVIRRPAAPPPLPPMPPQPEAENDWAAGDRAECIADGGVWRAWPTTEVVDGPKRGQILRVRRVVKFEGAIALTLVEYDSRGCYSAGYFRKLRPCSADFEEQIRTTAPAPRRIRAPLELVP